MKVVAPHPDVRIRTFYDYEIKGPFLTPSEADMFRVLEELAHRNVRIMCKPRLADVVQPISGGLSAFNKISQKHVDFLICSVIDWWPVFAVELDDASHDTKKRKEADVFKNELFASTGLPLIRIRVQELHYKEHLVANLNHCWNTRLGYVVDAGVR